MVVLMLNILVVQKSKITVLYLLEILNMNGHCQVSF